MTFNSLKISLMLVRAKSVIMFAMLLVYIGTSFFVSLPSVALSSGGRTDQHIVANSVTYIVAAHAMREGQKDVFLATAPHSRGLCKTILCTNCGCPGQNAVCDGSTCVTNAMGRGPTEQARFGGQFYNESS
jgi:hypothetical protein